MRNELLNDARREQELIEELREEAARAERLFIELSDVMNSRDQKLSALNNLQGDMNAKMQKGADEILDDIRTGKVGLVDVETGEPITVTLFQRR
jgi:hypothetical protein